MALIALVVAIAVVTVSVVLTTRDDEAKSTNNNEIIIQVGNNPFSSSSSGPNTKNITVDFTNCASTTTKLQLVKSDTDTLVTLVHLASDGNSFRPIGRSYDGKDWETAAGYYATKVVFDCDDGNGDDCVVTLPVPERDNNAEEGVLVEVVYQLTTFS